MIAEGRRKATGAKLLEGLNDLGRELYEFVGRAIPSVTRPNHDGIGTGGGQEVTAAARAHERATQDGEQRNRPQCPQVATPRTRANLDIMRV